MAVRRRGVQRRCHGRHQALPACGPWIGGRSGRGLRHLDRRRRIMAGRGGRLLRLAGGLTGRRRSRARALRGMWPASPVGTRRGARAPGPAPAGDRPVRGGPGRGRPRASRVPKGRCRDPLGGSRYRDRLVADRGLGPDPHERLHAGGSRRLRPAVVPERTRRDRHSRGHRTRQERRQGGASEELSAEGRSHGSAHIGTSRQTLSPGQTPWTDVQIRRWTDVRVRPRSRPKPAPAPAADPPGPARRSPPPPSRG